MFAQKIISLAIVLEKFSTIPRNIRLEHLDQAIFGMHVPFSLFSTSTQIRIHITDFNFIGNKTAFVNFLPG